MNQMRNPGSIRAALSLIQSCLHNGEYEDAERYAREALFMINMTDNFIPADKRSKFLADGSHWLAVAIFRLSQAGGIPPEEKQKAGEEAIALARKALELNTQLHGTEGNDVANTMIALAQVLYHFNDVDNDEILRFYEQAIAIFRRVEGSLSVNVAACENNLGNAYNCRATRAYAANDLDRCIANAELAVSHYREAARVFRAINHVDKADKALHQVAKAEEGIRQIGIARTAAAASRG